MHHVDGHPRQHQHWATRMKKKNCQSNTTNTQGLSIAAAHITDTNGNDQISPLVALGDM